MSQPLTSPEHRISLEAIRKLDDFARTFRRTLRDCAVQLSEISDPGAPLCPETIGRALPLACRELLSAAESNAGSQKGSDGRRPEAA